MLKIINLNYLSIRQNEIKKSTYTENPDEKKNGKSNSNSKSTVLEYIFLQCHMSQKQETTNMADAISHYNRYLFKNGNRLQN